MNRSLSLVQQGRLLRRLVDVFQAAHTQSGIVLADYVFDVRDWPDAAQLVNELVVRGFLQWQEEGHRFVLSDTGFNSVVPR